MWMPWGVWLMVLLIINSSLTYPRNSRKLIPLISDEDVSIEQYDIQDDKFNELYDEVYDNYINIMDNYSNELFKINDQNVTTREGLSYSNEDLYVRSSNYLLSNIKSSISDNNYSYNTLSISNNSISDSVKSLESNEYEEYFTLVKSEIPISLQNDGNNMENNELYDVNYDYRKPSSKTDILKHNIGNRFRNNKVTLKVPEKSTEESDLDRSDNYSYFDNSDYFEEALDNKNTKSNEKDFSDEIKIKEGLNQTNKVLVKPGSRTKRSANDKISDETEEDNYLTPKDKQLSTSIKSDVSNEIKEDITKEERYSDEDDENGKYHSLEFRGNGIEMGGTFPLGSNSDESNNQDENERQNIERKSRNFFDEPLNPLADEIEENKSKKLLGINDDEENNLENNEIDNSNITQNQDGFNPLDDKNISSEKKSNNIEDTKNTGYNDSTNSTKHFNKSKDENIELNNDSVLTALENIPDIEVLEVNTTDSLVRLNSNKNTDNKSHSIPKKVKAINDKSHIENKNSTAQKVINLDEKSHIQNKNSTSKKVKEIGKKPNTSKRKAVPQTIKDTYIKMVPKSDSKKKKHDESNNNEKIRINKGSKYINFIELDKMLEEIDEDENSVKRKEKSLSNSKSNSSEAAEGISPVKKSHRMVDSSEAAEGISTVKKTHRMVVNEKMSGKGNLGKDLTVTYNVNNNKILSYDLDSLYEDNKHLLDAIQNSIKVKDYKRVHLILNVENNTIDFKKRKKKSNKKVKSIKAKEKKHIEHVTPVKRKKNKKKKHKKQKIKSRQTKEIKYYPYSIPSLTQWRDVYDNPNQSDIQPQWPMKFYLPNINAYPVPYSTSPTAKNTPSLDDNFIAAIDFDQVYSLPDSHGSNSHKDPSSVKPKDGPFDRGKHRFTEATFKNTIEPAPGHPSTVAVGGHEISENLGEEVEGFWIVPSYSPGQPGYWMYPTNG